MLLLSAHALIVLLVLRVLVLPLGLLLTIEHRQLLLELVVLHAQLSTNGDEAAQTVDIVLVVLVNLLVDLQCLIEEVHSAVARSDHELPLDLLGLNLAGALEVLDSLLEHVLFSVVHTKARDHIDFRWVVAITLLVEMHRLELILFLLVEIAHLCEDFRV